MSYLVEDLQAWPNSGLDVPWAEACPRPTGTSADAQFGYGHSSTAAMTIIVEWGELEKVIPQLVGYPKVADDGANKTLKRVLPWKHPKWPQLWCSQISKIQGLSQRGELTPDVRGDTESYEQGVNGPTSAYRYAMLTLQFTRPKYKIKKDEDIANEWERFTTFQWQNSSQILSREGGQFEYSAGRPEGTMFPGTAGTVLARGKLTLTWHQLPYTAVYDSNNFPSQLYLLSDNKPRTGTVNDGVFFGCKAGTLLYTGVDIEHIDLPFPLGLIDQPNSEDTPFFCNVHMHFDHFDPIPGNKKSADGGGLIDERGHNLMPWAADLRFYPVQSVGYTLPAPDGLVGNGLYPFNSSTFDDLFTVLQ